MTCAHILDGTPFVVESEIRAVSKFPNTAIIALLDCCRLESKGTIPPTQKVSGQLALIHAVEPGKAAYGIPGQLSSVTSEFLETVRNSPLTFPACVVDWAKSHRTVQITDKMKYEISLKIGTQSSVSIPPRVSDWTPEILVEWLKLVDLSKASEYASVIIHPENRYDGKWLMRYSKQREKLKRAIPALTNSDMDIIEDELESWIQKH